MRALSLATVFAALSGFAILFIAPLVLDNTDDVASFMAYWGLFFAFTGFLDGLMQETTRAVATEHSRGVRPFRFALLFGGAAAIAVLGFSLGSAWLMALGLLSYTYQTVLAGVLSGLQLWNRYAALVALDSGVRFALILLAWWFGWGMPALLLTTVIGAASWLLLIRRELWQVRCEMSLSRSVHAMVASGASAALITGFAPAVHRLGHADAHVTMAAIMLAVTLTRAPILVPLQRFQSALIVRFVHGGSILPPIGAVLGVGVVGAAAAAAIGPWIMVTFWGEDYRVPALVLAALTFASACTGSLMITGAATLARQQHIGYVVGWVLATCVAFGVLALPLPLSTSVVLSLVFGPVAGMLAHWVSLYSKL